MARDLTTEELGNVVREVLEEASFTFLDPVSDDVAGADDVVEARLALGAPPAGWVQLEVDAALAPELAANMLGTGMPAGDASAMGESAVAELANVIAGVVAVRLYGTERLTDLGTPRVARRCGTAAGAAVPGGGAGNRCVRLCAGTGEIVRVTLCLEPDGGEAA